MNSEQLRARTGMSLRQLVYWVDKGWLRPTNPNCGTGHSFEFTPAEAGVAEVMVRLVAAKLHPAAAEQVARGQWELAPGITVLVDTSADPDVHAVDRAVVLLKRQIHRGPKARKMAALRASRKVGAHR